MLCFNDKLHILVFRLSVTQEGGRQADLRERHGFRRATRRTSRVDRTASSCVTNGGSSLLQTSSLSLGKKEKHFNSGFCFNWLWNKTHTVNYHMSHNDRELWVTHKATCTPRGLLLQCLGKDRGPWGVSTYLTKYKLWLGKKCIHRLMCVLRY